MAGLVAWVVAAMVAEAPGLRWQSVHIAANFIINSSSSSSIPLLVCTTIC
jgi:hypothetical protein